MTSELTKPHPSAWQIHQRDVRKIYSLALVHLNKQVDDAAKSRLFNLGGGYGNEFQFTMNPQSMGLVEPAAVVIRPTLGGQFVEHQGQIFKDITISGTTGLRPNRGITSVPIDRAKGVPFNERTGFDDLIDLRNLFRTYFMAKVDPDLASDVVMIWKNAKEGEYYIVEPISFRTNRESSSPLTSTYDIQLKTLGRWENTNRVKDSFLSRRSPTKERFFINQLIQALADGINRINNARDGLLSANGVLSLSARILTDILQPTNDLFSAIAGLANTSKRVLEIPRSAVHTLTNNLNEMIRELSSAVYTGGEIKRDLLDVIAALKTIHRTSIAIQARPGLFATSAAAALAARKRQVISRVVGAIDSGGDASALSNESLGSGVGQATVGYNDDIRKLAKRLLGNAARWKLLVIANGLKAPYISATGDGIDVLRPGSAILFPTNSSGGQSAVSTGNSSTLSPIEERLGRDLKLSAFAGSPDQFDLEVNANGDLALVEGTPNLVQAVRIKFETEQGELAMHPFFGIKYPIGVKAPSATGLIDFDINARSTLLSDQRIDFIRRLDIKVAGNTLKVTGDVTVKGFGAALTFDFSTRK